MIKSKHGRLVSFLLFLCLTSCMDAEKKRGNHFDELFRTIEIGNWQYTLSVENQGKKQPDLSKDLNGNHYLKVTLHLSNTKTKKSLLYSASKDVGDYEEMYKYLSFGSRDDLYIQYNEEFVYPTGYVFEPSNGLSNSEKLVYKFQINDDLFKKMERHNHEVEYWYIDRLTGLGKICFKQQ